MSGYKYSIFLPWQLCTLVFFKMGLLTLIYLYSITRTPHNSLFVLCFLTLPYIWVVRPTLNLRFVHWNGMGTPLPCIIYNYLLLMWWNCQCPFHSSEWIIRVVRDGLTTQNYLPSPVYTLPLHLLLMWWNCGCKWYKTYRLFLERIYDEGVCVTTLWRLVLLLLTFSGFNRPLKITTQLGRVSGS